MNEDKGYSFLQDNTCGLTEEDKQSVLYMWVRWVSERNMQQERALSCSVSAYISQACPSTNLTAKECGIASSSSNPSYHLLKLLIWPSKLMRSIEQDESWNRCEYMCIITLLYLLTDFWRGPTASVWDRAWNNAVSMWDDQGSVLWPNH